MVCRHLGFQPGDFVVAVIRIMIFGPKDDGTYVVEFRTAEGEALAISIPPLVFSEASLSPSFLRTTPAKNPRTECDCQPVDPTMVAIVAPFGRRSSSTTRSSVVPRDEGQRSCGYRPWTGFWRRIAPCSTAHACSWTCQNSSRWWGGVTARRTTQTPRRPNGTGGARGASPSGSASVTTIHAPFTTEVECKIAPVQADPSSNELFLRMLPAAKDRLLNLGRSCNPYHAAPRGGSPPPGLRLPLAKLSRNSNRIARGRIRRFESAMPSHAVVKLGGSPAVSSVGRSVLKRPRRSGAFEGMRDARPMRRALHLCSKEPFGHRHPLPGQFRRRPLDRACWPSRQTLPPSLYRPGPCQSVEKRRRR